MMTHDLRIAPRHSTALKYTKTVLHEMFFYRGKYFTYLNFPGKDLIGSLDFLIFISLKPNAVCRPLIFHT